MTAAAEVSALAEVLATIRQNPGLIPTILPAALAFVTDLRQDVRLVITDIINESVVSAFTEAHYLVAKTSCEALIHLCRDENPVVLKRAIMCCNGVYPLAFRVVCSVQADPTLWRDVTSIKDRIITLAAQESGGIKPYAIKFLEVIIVTQSFADPLGERQSRESSLDICPPNHPFLSHVDLQREASECLSQLFKIFNTSSTGVIVTGAVNALFPICRTRPQFMQHIVQSLISLIKSPPSGLTPLESKSLEKTVKNNLMMVLGLSFSELAPLVPLISEILIGLGARGQDIAVRIRQREQGASKRAAAAPADPPETKRQRTSEYLPSETFNPHSLPLPLVIDVIIHTVLSIPTDRWVESVVAFAAAQLPGSVQAATDATLQLHVPQSRDPRRRDPRISSKSTALVDPSANQKVLFPPDIMASLPLNIQQQLKDEMNRSIGDDIRSEYANVKVKDESMDIDSTGFVGSVASSALVPVTLVEPEFAPSSVLLHELDAESALSCLTDTIDRILDLEPVFSTQISAPGVSVLPPVPSSAVTSRCNNLSAARSGWMLLLSRILSNTSHSNESLQWNETLTTKLLNFVLEDFRARHELAVFWLYEEMRMELALERKQHSKGHNSRYQALFNKILEGLKGPTRGADEKAQGLDPKDRTFTKFLVDAPLVPIDAVKTVVTSYCEDPERMALGLTTLRDLILMRPSVRDLCLDLLLSYCTHPCSETLCSAQRWVGPDHATVGPRVLSFALKTLQKLKDVIGLQEGTSAQDEALENSGTWTEVDVVRHFELFFALISKKHELLSELFSLFGHMHKDVSGVVISHIQPLIKSMSSSPEKLVSLIEDFPAAAEPLVIKVVSILVGEAGPRKDLVGAVLHVFKERDLDAAFILPVLMGMEKSDVLASLGKILKILDGSDTQKEIVESALMKVVSDEAPAVAGTLIIAAPKEEQKGPNISPIELLVAIHNLEDSVGLPRCLEATKMCFGRPEVFKEEVLGAVIQQLIDQPKLPALFMRTVLESIKVFNGLTRFVINNVLTRLISKKVWTNPKLWEGFIRCCVVTVPTSFQILIQLPRHQLDDLLQKAPQLSQQLAEYLTTQPPTTRAKFKNLFQ